MIVMIFSVHGPAVEAASCMAGENASGIEALIVGAHGCTKLYMYSCILKPSSAESLETRFFWLGTRGHLSKTDLTRPQ